MADSAADPAFCSARTRKRPGEADSPEVDAAEPGKGKRGRKRKSPPEAAELKAKIACMSKAPERVGK